MVVVVTTFVVVIVVIIVVVVNEGRMFGRDGKVLGKIEYRRTRCELVVTIVMVITYNKGEGMTFSTR